jgi:hypothetical protein
MPDTETPDTNKEAQANKESKKAEREALKEQQKREMPTDNWPGKGDH